MQRERMQFDIQKRVHKNLGRYIEKDVELARSFAKILYKELGLFLSAVILFGSSTQPKPNPKHDVDILVVLDDVRVKFSRELVETYRIIIDKAVSDTDPERLHVQSMKLTAFWDYVRSGDPVAVNILRSGVAIIDTGFFDPLQILLDEGRIRPSEESIWTYFTMAPASIQRSKQHLLSATVDLYWACIDAAHAALMKIGEIPPSPSHVAEMVIDKLAGNRHITRKHGETMQMMYDVFKKIIYRDIKDISGKQYDQYAQQVSKFVDAMKEIVEAK